MSLYTDLGVAPDADRETIARAHREAAKRHHPDAGGKREDFERVSRAWLVLRDPAKRARYDQTGETEDRPNNPMADFAEIIVPAFDAALNEAGDRFEYIDIVANAKMRLRQSVSDITTEIAKAKGMRKRFEKTVSRLKFSGDGPDFIGHVMRDRVDQITRSIALFEQQRAKIEEAIKLADVYGWDTIAQPQQSTFAVWTMS